jgi:hypothetical protein
MIVSISFSARFSGFFAGPARAAQSPQPGVAARHCLSALG